MALRASRADEETATRKKLQGKKHQRRLHARLLRFLEGPVPVVNILLANSNPLLVHEMARVIQESRSRNTRLGIPPIPLQIHCANDQASIHKALKSAVRMDIAILAAAHT